MFGRWGLFPEPSWFRYRAEGPACVGEGCGRSFHNMLMKPSETFALRPLFKGKPCSISTPCSRSRSLSSRGSPEARVVMASRANLVFLTPRPVMSLMTLVLLLALTPPLEASADLPSLARVGFFLIFSINVENWPGMMDSDYDEHVRKGKEN